MTNPNADVDVQNQILDRVWNELDQQRKDFKGYSSDIKKVSDCLIRVQSHQEEQGKSIDTVMNEIRSMYKDMKQDMSAASQAQDTKVHKLELKHDELDKKQNKIAMILVFVGGAIYAFGGKVFTGIGKILMSV